MRIAYIFPSRNRPEKFFHTLDVIQAYSDNDNYFVWAKLDDNDEKKHEYEKRLSEYPEVTVCWGKSEGKIHAVNRSLENLPPCDILIVMSDDMCAEVAGFDEEIRNHFKKHFPLLDGVIHTDDGHCSDRTMTLTIMGINLYKKLGYLYHPDFLSVYADNHLTELTKSINKHIYINKVYFRHFHPVWNAALWDEQYRRTESPEFYKKDHETYLKLKANNYGL